MVDATIIAAPSSTKNLDHARDPAMHQTKKGNAWHFGMKAHIGVDAESGLTHTLVTTPANTADVTVADQLLHGHERYTFGDAGYRGIEKRHGTKQKRPHWHVAMRPGKRSALPDTRLGRILEKIEYYKASVRAKAEHPFHIIKNLLGLKKIRYRGLAKNTRKALDALWLGQSNDCRQTTWDSTQSNCVLSELKKNQHGHSQAPCANLGRKIDQCLLNQRVLVISCQFI